MHSIPPPPGRRVNCACATTELRLPIALALWTSRSANSSNGRLKPTPSGLGVMRPAVDLSKGGFAPSQTSCPVKAILPLRCAEHAQQLTQAICLPVRSSAVALVIGRNEMIPGFSRIAVTHSVRIIDGTGTRSPFRSHPMIVGRSWMMRSWNRNGTVVVASFALTCALALPLRRNRPKAHRDRPALRPQSTESNFRRPIRSSAG